MFTNISAQTCAGISVTTESEIQMNCNTLPLTMMHDNTGLPYLYVANKSVGLTIYNISDINNPSLLATLPATQFSDLHVTNLCQQGSYLYLSLGNSFGSDLQAGGMAVVDISNITFPVLTDYIVIPKTASGAGAVKVLGNYAFLGVMRTGLAILDIANKSDIKITSVYKPSINYPPIANPDTLKINARGIELVNDLVYLSYDAGGMRIIDCTDKYNPKEVGQYANPITYVPFNRPRAYNNALLDFPYLYVAVDYCGVEVLNVSDTADISLVSSWNPYNCPNNNWFNTPVHANEIQLDTACNKLFLSTGKSDMIALDVTNPNSPDSCFGYGGVDNSIGTWGVNIYENQIYLSYICSVIPFSSNWPGIKVLSYNSCLTNINEVNKKAANLIVILPGVESIRVTSNNYAHYYAINTLGQQTKLEIIGRSQNTIELNTTALSAGVYYIVTLE